MKACMTYSTSTTSTTLGTDMSILVSKPTECAAEYMIILSEFSFVCRCNWYFCALTLIFIQIDSHC